MHQSIRVRKEGPRGCGWRKTGGLYMMSEGEGTFCGRLPIPCGTCPCCNRGIKPARGWSWIDADEVIRAAPPCKIHHKPECLNCVINQMTSQEIGQAGLIWIGESHYPTVRHFQEEAERMGISRRIRSVPKDFVLGETYILLAHKKAIINEGEVPAYVGEEVEYSPGIFRIFKPTRIEVIVDGTEDDEVIDGYIKRGLVPVLIEKIETKQDEMALDDVA